MSAPIDQDEPPRRSSFRNNSIMCMTDLKGDWSNFFLLLLLYTMQGFPLGLSSAIPIILQDNDDGSYQDQALFSLVMWPFSLKLLWAPLVDALYVQKIGRRKSWLVPVQYAMGICFFVMAQDINEILPETGKPNVMMLVYMFFVANFLAATQDIVVDGWALTMLRKNNVCHASTCNTAGQTIGFTLGSMFSILLTSENFCNTYLRSTPDSGGLVSMKSLLYICGALFILATTLVAIFKKEKDNTLEEDHIKLNVFQNYTLLWEILKLPCIRVLAFALLISRIGFCVTDSVTALKLIDAGVSKDDIAVISTTMCLVKIFLPLVMTKYTTGPKPMTIFLNATLMKLFWSPACVLLVYYTPMFINPDNEKPVPVSYYVFFLIVILIDEVLFYIMFVALIAFFARISDSRFGGTYITFLNTITNLGTAWTSTVAFGMIDVLTFKECSLNPLNDCSTQDKLNECESIGGECITTVNGFYVGTFVCMVLGCIWYVVFKKTLENLQTKSSCHWIVNVKKMASENIDNSHAITISRTTIS